MNQKMDEKTFKANIREKIKRCLQNTSTPEGLYELFRILNYPKDYILDSTYKRNIEDFGFNEDIRKKIKNIYTILNVDQNLLVFLIEIEKEANLSSFFIREVIKTLSKKYENFLTIFVQNFFTFLFVLPEFERIDVGKYKLKITKLFIQKNDIYYTALEVLSNLYYTNDDKDWRSIYKKWKEAFSVKRVTEEFFEDYKRIFFKIREEVEKQGVSRKDAHEFSLQLLNRIMFIYFLAKKRWLANDVHFMKSYWNSYLEEKRAGNVKQDSFYEVWLKNLFFKAFNNKQHEIRDLPEKWIKEFLKFPYLNGGLFTENRLDNLNIKLRDSIFSEIFEFLNKYNFTIKEDMPLEQEVAVDPAMIGYVYESLANVAEEIYDRTDLGIFYTPRIEVDFMCRRALVEYLSKKLPNIPKEKLYEFVFDEDKENVEKYFSEIGIWEKLEDALNDLTVVDPACGSGSFLVGMLNVLYELYKVIYKNLGRKWRAFDLKNSIIARSLYGVDVMPWAVHAAELRLWLQLIIETEFNEEQLKERPLLPNFSLNLRVGDSLVQEIGGMIISLKSKDIPENIRKKLLELKKEKEKYYYNMPTRFGSKEEILREEIKIFQEITDYRIETLKNELKNLNEKLEKIKKNVQLNLLGQKIAPSGEKIETIEKRIAEINNQLRELSEIKNRLRDSMKHPENKPFIWEIDFAEVFGEKGGFDIVIGNPPYVRQEKISPPNKIKAEVTLEDKRKYKEKLIESVKLKFPVIEEIDKRSDYYVYFYFHGLSLLNKNGVFCFITSNSWLDVGYGKDLQEFLLKYVPMIAIYDCPRRSFEHADINTVIVLFGAPYEEATKPNIHSKKWPALDNVIKFVLFKKPYEEVSNSKILIEIEKINPKVRGKNFTELATNMVITENYKCFPVYQEDLLQDGWEYPEGYDPEKSGKFNSGKYIGNKLGGKYLRAPEIFFRILEKGKGKFIRLGDIADVRFGIKTGANEFFYLEPVGMTVKEVVEFSQRNPNKLIRVRNGAGWEGFIEAKFLKPIVKSPKELKTIAVRLEDLNYLVFICNEPKNKLKGTKALEYIEWGEKQGYHKRPTCKSRERWWNLGEWKIGQALCIMTYGDRYIIWLNDLVLADARFYNIYLPNKDFLKFVISLNSIISFLCIELNSRANLTGALDFKVYEAKEIYLPILDSIDNEIINTIIKNLSSRQINSIFKELGFDPKKPIREQEPNPLPDRKALDDIVFDALGLTEQERKEVYWTLAELVKERMEKAKSIKRKKSS